MVHPRTKARDMMVAPGLAKQKMPAKIKMVPEISVNILMCPYPPYQCRLLPVVFYIIIYYGKYPF